MTIAVGNFFGPRFVDTAFFAGPISGGRLFGSHLSGAGSFEPVTAPVIGNQSVWWQCFEELAIQYDSAGVGSEKRILLIPMLGDDLEVYAVRQVSGDFTARLKQGSVTLANGTTEYAYEPTFHTCRITITGNQWGVEMGGTLECNVRNNEKPSLWAILIGGGGGSSILWVKAQGATFCGGADGNDRPSINNIVRWLRPNGNGTDNQLLGDSLGWDDWSEDADVHDGDGSYQWAPDAAGTYFETSQMDTFTITDTLRAIKQYSMTRNDDTTKQLSIEHVLHDGATRDRTFIRTWQSTAWAGAASIHDLSASGNAWSQAELDKVELGVSLQSAGTTQGRATAIGGEALDLALDPGDLPVLSGGPLVNPPIRLATLVNGGVLVHG